MTNFGTYLFKSLPDLYLNIQAESEKWEPMQLFVTIEAMVEKSSSKFTNR
jgi:hypothetical protein